MNAPLPHAAGLMPALHEVLLAALAPAQAEGSNEAAWLAQCHARCAGDPVAVLTHRLQDPADQDTLLLSLAAHFRLGLAELIALVLALAVERVALAGRVLAWLQAPVASSRPSLGLISSIAERFGVADAVNLSLIHI